MKKKDNYKEFEETMKLYDILNPMVSFEGEIFLSTKENYTNALYDKEKDVLYLNSKVDKKGKNMYMELLKRTFYSGLRENIAQNKTPNEQLFCPLIMTKLCDNRKGRKLCYSYQLTIINIGLTIKRFPYVEDDINSLLERIKEIKEELIKRRNRYASILREKDKSPYYEQYKKEEKEINLEKTIEAYNQMIQDLRSIKEKIKREEEKGQFLMDKKELEECFSLDTLLMIVSKCILSNQMAYDKTSQIPIIPAFVEVAQYIEGVKSLDLEGYNPTIRYYDENKKQIVRYSFQDLVREYKKIVRKHPEYETLKVNPKNIEKLDIIRDADGLENYAKMYEEQSLQALKVGWEILPAGKKEEKLPSTFTEEKVKAYVKNREEHFTNITTEDDIIFRKCMYETTEYKLKIIGVDDFAGYVGYVYENGLIFFERFYEDETHHILAQNRATYVMNFETFLKKLTRQEFINFIKSTNDPTLCRLYHTPTWHIRVKQKINSIDYTPESKILIETLLEQSQAKKVLK